MVEAVKLTDIIGTSGKYQLALNVICYYSALFIGTSVLTVEFLAPMVTMHWDWDASNPNRTVFWSNDCNMEDILELNRTSNSSNSDSKLIYESQYSRRTLTEELNLVCSRSWLVSLANFLGLMGKCAGYLLLRLSEMYGRRPMIILVSLASVALSLCISFTSGYAMFAASCFFFRATTTQAHVFLFIQVLEVATPSQSPYISVVMASAPIVAQVFLVGAAWILKDWFHTQMVQTALVALYLLVIWWTLESPVWLAVRGRYEESKQVLLTIVRRNGGQLQEAEPKINAWIEEMKVRCEVETTAEKGKVTDLFKNRVILLYTSAMTYTLISTTVVYSGLVINAESFGSGMYLELTLSSVLSLAFIFICTLLLRKISVRDMLFYTLLLVGLVCAAYPFTYEFPMARSIISVVGRLLVTPIFNIGRQYMNDIFPTSVRGVGIGFCGLVSNLLSSTTPFTKELGEVTSVYVPFILFAFLGLSSALVYKALPDIKGKPMLHTVHELKKRRKEENKS